MFLKFSSLIMADGLQVEFIVLIKKTLTNEECIFSLTLTLVSFCSFANSDKLSVVVPNNIEVKELFNIETKTIDVVNVKYVFDSALCYAEIYYRGELVATVQASGSGYSSFVAQSDCLNNANKAATAYIAMAEVSFSQN